MTEVKRTNYATGQFLTAADFTREQDYHRTLRRLHNANLNTWGVAGGLDVTKVDDTHVQVGPGLALDRQGREIVVTDPVALDLAAQAGSSTQLYVVIAYQEVQDPADKVAIGGADAYVATTERPAFSFFDPGGNGTPANALPEDAITLALLTLDGGKVSALDASRRRPAGSLLAPTARFAELTVADLTVSERIKTGHVFFDAGALAVDLATNVMDVASIQNSANDQALLIHGRTTHDGSGGGGIERRIKLIDAVEVTGSLKVSPLPGATSAEAQQGIVTIAGNMQVGGIFADSLSLKGGMSGGGTLFFPNVNGGNFSCSLLSVSSAAYIYADVHIQGRLLATSKTGYVMDRFVNRLGESLEVGDVVVLGANAPTLAYGPADSIPVPEVDLTDTAGDTRVCGIVCEVHGESAGGEDGGMKVYSDAEREGMDLATVGPGQLGHMVTLGTYAVCKVDADIAPIAAGDLLTTSPTRGHAQKVLDRTAAIGAIVGKALAPLASGRGTIPVLVTLH